MNEELFPFAVSSSIDIYPWSSDRGLIDQELIDRHVLSEENLKLLWSNFTDFPSYVLSYDLENENTKFIKFVMHGYYFRLSNQDLLAQPNLWVKCAVTTTAAPYNALAGFDDAGEASENPGTDINKMFTGLYFSPTAPTANNPYEWLHLIETTSEGTKRVPIISMFKFSAKSIAGIDGGTV